MNTNTIQRRNALERIVQMILVDYKTQQRGMLFGLGSLLLIIAALPRLFCLFPEVTYQSWSENIASSGSAYSRVMLGICAAFGSMMSLYYLNRRVLHARPIAFALLPARLWEKVTAHGLFAIGVNLSTMLVFGISEVLNVLTVDGYTSVFVAEGANIGLFSLLHSIELGGDALLLHLVNIAVLLSAVLAAISFRRLRVGIFVYWLGWMVLVFFGSILALYLAGLALTEPNISVEMLQYVGMALLVLMNIGLAWGIYYRLRRIEC